MTTVVLGRKYDGRPHYEYRVQLLAPSRPWVCIGIPGEQTIHHTGGFKLKPWVGYSLFFFPTDAYYVVTWGFDIAGSLALVRCDVSTPPTWVDGRIEYVDLDLDVIADRGKAVVLDDRDEFEAHQTIYGYPQALITGANLAADRLLEAASRHRFPFGIARPADVLQQCFDQQTLDEIRAAHPWVAW